MSKKVLNRKVWVYDEDAGDVEEFTCGIHTRDLEVGDTIEIAITKLEDTEAETTASDNTDTDGKLEYWLKLQLSNFLMRLYG
jgi:hypothetical protein